jgi:hypothetical protein
VAPPPDQSAVDGATPPDLTAVEDAASVDLVQGVSCNDGVRNGTETDVDCGGDACPLCRLGQSCNVDGDCVSSYCAPFHICTTIECFDGYKNGDETGVDCGGSRCPACPNGEGCRVNSDCITGYCNPSNICVIPECFDAVKNGSETGVDCGGPVCQRCFNGEGCRVNGDCLSNYCTPAQLCQMADCSNGIQDGNESDIDCGGGCRPCQVGQGCRAATDCITGSCSGGTCVIEDSCRSIKGRNAFVTSGVYQIDPDGSGGAAPPFSVHCDMDIDGGGWTLITSLSRSAPITAVDRQTTITPASVNVTNRGMRLPGVTQILTVTDGQDTGPYDPGSGGTPGELSTYFDKWEVYAGATGLFDDDGTDFTWQDILDALNLDSGRAWVRSPGGPAPDEPWQFDVRRVNTGQGTCLQVPLRGAYGDGNHGGSNSPDLPRGISSIGALWHHWAGEDWTSGVNNEPELHCNQLRRTYSKWWRGVYLR